jgi:hypothetical protein
MSYRKNETARTKPCPKHGRAFTSHDEQCPTCNAFGLCASCRGLGIKTCLFVRCGRKLPSNVGKAIHMLSADGVGMHCGAGRSGVPVVGVKEPETVTCGRCIQKMNPMLRERCAHAAAVRDHKRKSS